MARGNWGVVTTKAVRAAGIPPHALRRLAQDKTTGLSHVVYGVYNMWDDAVPNDYISEATGIAVGGAGSVLYGWSVLAMFDLEYANPSRTMVASPNLRVGTVRGPVRIASGAVHARECTMYFGIPSTSIARALRDTCQGAVDWRMEAAAQDAYRRGLITPSELDRLIDYG